MALAKTIPIDELALLWVSTMIYYTKKIPHRIAADPYLTQKIELDSSQFRAIAYHLEMLLCTRPSGSWAKYVWRQNFTFYLSQIIHRSQLFFQHLGSLPHSTAED